MTSAHIPPDMIEKPLMRRGPYGIEFLDHLYRTKMIQRQEPRLELYTSPRESMGFGGTPDLQQLSYVERAVLVFCATHPLVDRMTLSCVFDRNASQVSMWLAKLKRAGWLREIRAYNGHSLIGGHVYVPNPVAAAQHAVTPHFKAAYENVVNRAIRATSPKLPDSSEEGRPWSDILTTNRLVGIGMLQAQDLGLNSEWEALSLTSTEDPSAPGLFQDYPVLHLYQAESSLHLLLAFVRSPASPVALADHWARLIDSADGRCSTHITGVLVASRFEEADSPVHDSAMTALRQFKSARNIPVVAARYDDIDRSALLGRVYRMQGERQLVSPLDFWQPEGRASAQPYERQVSLSPRPSWLWGWRVFRPVCPRLFGSRAP